MEPLDSDYSYFVERTRHHIALVQRNVRLWLAEERRNLLIGGEGGAGLDSPAGRPLPPTFFVVFRSLGHLRGPGLVVVFGGGARCEQVLRGGSSWIRLAHIAVEAEAIGAGSAVQKHLGHWGR